MAEPTLKNGSKGQDVKDLQEALKTLGFNPGPVDGIFGAKTETAVRAFQTDRGITVDGIVGRETWHYIDEADHSQPVLRKGSRGLPVRRLQHRLSTHGFDTKGVDGRFGPNTETAVKHFQSTRGLVVDGIVGPATWAEVEQLAAG
jgi:peptidoglycan hydrolase-like protein with peptidoglycan-binding domain